MKIFLSLFKKIFFVLIGIIVSFTIAMVALNKQSFVISNDDIQKIVSYYNNDFIIQTEGAKLEFLGHKIQLSIPKTKLTSDKDHSIILQNSRLTLNMLKLNGQIKTQISNSEIISLIFVKNRPEIMSVVDNIISHNYLICDGDITASFGVFKRTQTALNLFGKTGWNNPNRNNLSKLNLKEFTLKMNYKSNKISVEKLQLEYINSFKASFSGDFTLSFGELVLAEFKTEIIQFPIDYLDGFWPADIFPDLQNWIVSHVSKGIVSRAQGKFQLTKEDLKADLPRKESIDVLLDLQDMDLKYLEQYSSISKINGILKIDGHGLYLDAKTAETSDSKLTNIKLSLPFDNFVLSLKSDVSGDIAKFNQFVPQELSSELLNYNINFASIKGALNGSFELALPIFEEFKLSNMKLDIKADINDVALDKKGLVKFKKGSFELLNEEEKIKVKLLGEKNILLEFDMYHDQNLSHENQINITTEIDTKDKLVFKEKISLNSGVIKPKINLTGKTWKIDLDLTDAELCLLTLGYTKPKSTAFSLQCSGEMKDNFIESKSCNLNGKGFKGDILFVYSITEEQLIKLELNNIKLGENDFSLQTLYDKKAYNYKLSAKYLDLTNYSLDSLVSNDNASLNYNIAFKVNKMIMPNKNYLHDVSGKISQIGKNPVIINFEAFANNEKISIVKIKRNEQDGYMLHGKDAGTFSQDFGIYKNIKKGEIWIEGYPKKTDDGVSYYGTIKLEKFALTNTSAFAKVILGVLSVTSPKALSQTLQGGSLKADSFDANWTYDNEILHIKNAVIIGSSYDIKFAGSINFKDKAVNIKGVCIPSVFGINTIVSNLPLFGRMLSGGKDSAFIGSNFSVKGDMKAPKVSFGTLSSFTPGFIRNLFD